jgi:hypothetical protein
MKRNLGPAQWMLAASLLACGGNATAKEGFSAKGVWPGQTIDLPECPWASAEGTAGTRKYTSEYAEDAPCFAQDGDHIGQGAPTDGAVKVQFPRGPHEKDYKRAMAVVRNGKVRMVGVIEFASTGREERLSQIIRVLGEPSRSGLLPTVYTDPPPAMIITRAEWDMEPGLLVRCDVGLAMQVCMVMPDPMPDDLKVEDLMTAP